MPKVCKICSADQGIQDEVSRMRNKGSSLRDIEASLMDQYNFSVSSTSIGRHLTSCVQPKNERITLKPLEASIPDNQQVHQELCHALVHAIRFFNATLDEMTEAPANVEIHLNAVKALDVLINGFEKLYQNPKEGTAQTQIKLVLSDLQLKLMKEVADLPEKPNDDAVKEKVSEILKNHEALKQQNYL
jgi:hypothetical protein